MCSNVSLLTNSYKMCFYSLKPDMNMHIFLVFYFGVCTMESEVVNNSSALTEGMVGLLFIREFVKVFLILLNISL